MRRWLDWIGRRIADAWTDPVETRCPRCRGILAIENDGGELHVFCVAECGDEISGALWRRTLLWRGYTEIRPDWYEPASAA